MMPTLVPYFDWSFDAPTTAYLGEERKSFCISATVRDMVEVEIDDDDMVRHQRLRSDIARGIVACD